MNSSSPVTVPSPRAASQHRSQKKQLEEEEEEENGEENGIGTERDLRRVIEEGTKEKNNS